MEVPEELLEDFEFNSDDERDEIESDFTDSSNDSDDDEAIAVQLKEVHRLREWAVLFNVKTATDALLAILGRRLIPGICKSSKTLLKTTKARYGIEEMADSKGNVGEFVYIGIAKQLEHHVNPDFHDFITGPDSKAIEIDCNVDGFKVFKSSAKDAWVIACKLVDKLCLYKPFTVAIF